MSRVSHPWVDARFLMCGDTVGGNSSLVKKNTSYMKLLTTVCGLSLVTASRFLAKDSAAGFSELRLKCFQHHKPSAF